MNSKPQKEHQWLQKLVGEWVYEGQPPVRLTGMQSVRSLGGLWFLCEGHSEIHGGGTLTIMTLGYDPVKKRYIGTFIGSMMPHMWIYEGELDSTGNMLTLNTEGPSFTAGADGAKYKDVIEFMNDDHRVLSSNCLGDDGKWHNFMTAHYRRIK